LHIRLYSKSSIMSSSDISSLLGRCRRPLAVAAMLTVTAVAAQVTPTATTAGTHDTKQSGRAPSAKIDYQANALARCNVLQGDDKAACQARMMGHGQVTGSVAGGGLLRQLEVVQVPPGATQVKVQPKTADAVMVLPSASATTDAPVKVVPVPAQTSGQVVMQVPPH